MATIDQLYALKAAAQRCISATEAVTLTHNPSPALAVNLAAAEADLVLALAAAGAGGSGDTAFVTNGYGVTAKDLGEHTALSGLTVVSGNVVGSVLYETGKSIITTATKITAPVTGTGTTGVTPTIVNGLVTGLVLS